MMASALAPIADEEAIRLAMVEASRSMSALGLTQGTSGNISVRVAEGLLITPSGMPYDRMRTVDIVRLDMDGTPHGSRKPSTEWRFHRDLVAARPEIGAVVHAHPTYSTAFAMCGMEVPAVHYMIAAAGGPTVRCAPYAPFGTQELSALVLEAMHGRSCCLLANHGMIAAGPNLERAMWLAVELETLCRQYAVALQVGRPVVLSDDEIARTLEAFRTYGPQDDAVSRD